MKKFLAVVLLCLPAFGQGTYSGRGVDSGPAAYGAASVCGPPNYSCFNSTTSVVNLTNPIPSWGANTCNSTSMLTLETCGNLTGAGYSNTPSDFGNLMMRITDVNTPSSGYQVIFTYDDPFPTAWNNNDTGLLVREMDLIHGNGIIEVVMTFNPITMTAAMTSPLLSLGSGNLGVWSHTASNIIYQLSGTKLYSNVVVMTPGSASLTPTLMFDYNSSNCLTNSVNGYTGGSFTATWSGLMTSSLDDTVFAMAFSNTGAQGTGTYVTAWTVGQSGCDLYNTQTGIVTHNGALVSTPSPNGAVADQWGAAANGGIPDLFTLHDTFTALSDNYVWLDATSFYQGVYNDGPYIWQIGTDSVKHCGIGAGGWTASHLYNVLGYRIQPSSGNAGGYIYQIITSGGEGTSGSSPPTWNQTPGSNTTDGTVTWRNTGLGTAQSYYCSGHNWNGATGQASDPNHTPQFSSYANPATPLSNQGPASPFLYGDEHYGSTNDNINDTAWIFHVGAIVPFPVNWLSTLPDWGIGELMFFSPVNVSPGVPNFVGTGGTLGQVRRIAHEYNTSWSWVFDIQSSITMISQTGKFALLSTDLMGQLGQWPTSSYPSGRASCNIGGPNWDASDSTNFQVGSYMEPNYQFGGNPGQYIYMVKSCSGACETGSTEPTWPQSSTVAGVGTFTDGTITWEAAPDVYTSTNTAVQNCRADLMVVKLTR